jgi:nucleoside-diphosphate-sugar epimerase
MRVLLTGALGNVGSHTIHELVRAGHQVRALDLATKLNRKRARSLPPGVELAWGNMTDEASLARAAQGVEHVLHLAAVIPPLSDADPALAYRVNVGGMRRLLRALQDEAPGATVTFCSTAAVYGRNLEVEGPRGADEALHPEDSYGRQKAECEQILRASGQPFSIFRLGVTPPVSGAGFDPFVFKFHPYTRVEFTHPEDVALALARSVGNREILGRTLLIAGGAHNRYLYRDWLNEALERVGVGRFPLEAFGERAFYTDWMDTTESQARLSYQRRSYADYLDEITRGVGPARHLVRALRPLVQAYLLAQSPYYRANLGKPLTPLRVEAALRTASKQPERTAREPGQDAQLS